MAEKIVSPGVFTREKDLSFLPQGISEIGAAIVGPFAKGPAFIPTIIETQADFERIFGTPSGTYYTPYTVQSYLRESGTVTVVRVAGIGGYTQTSAILIRASSSTDEKIVAVLHNSKEGGSSLLGFSGSEITQSGDSTDFLIHSASIWAYSGSLSTGSADYVANVFGTDPLGSTEPYVYKHFKNILGDNFQSVSLTMDVISTTDQVFTNDATVATTPWIKSQLLGDQRFNLFRFHTHGHGEQENTQVKVSIENVKAAGSISGITYGQFTVVIRKYSDTDSKLNVLETFQGVNLDPNSPNYIARVIGDRYLTVNSSGKISEHGNWAKNSNYVRIEVKSSTDYPIASIPAAISQHTLPILAGVNDTLVPPVTFVTRSVDDTSTYSGLDFLRGDNKQYHAPLPVGASTGSNVLFALDSAGSGESGSTACGLDLTLTTTAEVNKRKFTFGFQGGFNGLSPNVPINLETSMSSANTQGLDLSSSTTSGSVAYAKAINTLQNKDEFDINLLVTPGVVRRLHTSTVTAAVSMVEARADCFYIVDLTAQTDTIAQSTTQADAINTSYAGGYYPWVRIVDVNTNRLLACPPSVVLPRVYAANDKAAAEWFAVAGLNRGGIIDAVSVVSRLTHAERDELYENRVNPIAIFPGQGVSVWGQKTLQQLPSALDRINVRRLLIGLKKFIASTTRFLVFEQNTSQTRSRFLNIVSPYLEQVQQRQGLYAFRVVMDESNNTPDVIDRNILYGQIYIQPAKTAEFIVIDFNIMPTGASFSQ